MASAVAMLEKQLGRLADPSLQERGAELVSVDDFLLDIQRDQNLDLDIAGSITSGYIERTMDGATTLQVVVYDPDKVLIKSGMFGDGTFFKFDEESPYRDIDSKKPHFKAIDVNLDGLWFRLVQIEKQGSSLTLTFQDRIVSYLKLHNSPRKASRADLTRAQFIRLLVREVKNQEIEFISPELTVKQPIDAAKLQHPDASVKRHKRDVGLLNTTDLNVKGTHATKTQLTNAEIILDEGTALSANRKCLVASIMTTIQESTLINLPGGDGTSIGLFQQTANGAWGSASDRHDPKKASHMFFDACIKADRNDPGLSLNDLCQAVQGSASPNAYGQWTKEAKKIVDEYGGGSGGSSEQTRSYYKRYEYHRGPPDGPHKENTWDCSGRLGEEVNWRRFVVGNSFFYVRDADLIRAKPVDEIAEDDDGIETIDWDIDSDKPISEATIECRADRWFARPGEVIKLKDQGPASTRWLVYTIHRDLFSTKCEITLRVPEAAKPEPAPELVTVSTGIDTSGIPSGGVIGGPMRKAIVAAANKAAGFNSSKYDYAEVRPIPRSLFGKGRIKTDCSGFVTLCFKAAGAEDPNGNNYNGSGNTGTLIANAHKIHAGQLMDGDLVFYGGTASYPGHVAIYDKDANKVISFGSQGGPRVLAVNYREDLIGYYRISVQANSSSNVPIQDAFLPDTPTNVTTPIG